jgi:hypothetical protein
MILQGTECPKNVGVTFLSLVDINKMRQETFMPPEYKIKQLADAEREERRRKRSMSKDKTEPKPSRKQSSSSKYSYDKKKEVQHKEEKMKRVIFLCYF